MTESVIDHSALRRSWPEEGHTRVPAWVYSDESIYRRELDTFFSGSTWNFVGLECELPTTGSYKRSWIGERQVIVVRDADGINVIENRCAHRGAAVCWKNSGTAKELVCPYHQWSYNLKGELEGVPFRRGVHGEGGMPADFDQKKLGLRRLRVAVRNGLIWASFSRDVPDFADYCGPELLTRIDRLFPGKPLRLVGQTRQSIPSNWKLYFENTRDPYHATLLHTFFITFGLFSASAKHHTGPTGESGRHLANYSVTAGKKVIEETSEMKRFDENLTLEDTDTVRHRDEFGDRQNSGLQVFPSVFIQQHFNSLAVRQIVPRGVNKMEVIWNFIGYEDDDEDMRQLRLKQSNLVGPAGFVSADDGEVLKQVQTTVKGYPDSVGFLEMGGRDVEQQDTTATEAAIRAFYKFYRREMGL
jgi:anthranilate 1,2-dioxygenase large subunit